jgi:hypothetical protein
MNDRVEELKEHRKFLNKSEDDIDQQLKEMKRQQSAGVFYFLCWNEKYPGYASLRFILGQTPRDHPIGIVPDGYQWGKKNYSNLDRLLNDFKKNPRGPGGAATGPPSRPAPPKAAPPSRPSRWGAPRPPPPTSQPPPPPSAPAQTGWGAPAAPATGWGAPSASGGPPQHSLPPAPSGYPPQMRPPPPPGAPPAYQRSEVRQ